MHGYPAHLEDGNEIHDMVNSTHFRINTLLCCISGFNDEISVTAYMLYNIMLGLTLVGPGYSLHVFVTEIFREITLMAMKKDESPNTHPRATTDQC